MIYSSPLPGAHVLDTATLVVYLLAAAACLISSAGWHVLSGCAAKRWFEWGACVDCES
jgi:adiponectin receptor